MEIPLWQRAEWNLQSSKRYDNPLQAVELSATFTAPSGKVQRVYGFWDGGDSWKVRFAPDESGTWTLETHASDPHLTDKQQFRCSAAQGDTPFELHGPVRVSANRHHFEHADGTPFLWLADTGWNGPLLARDDDWADYLQTRKRQGFTAIQWVATQWIASPRGDHAGRTAYTGNDQIEINPQFFQALDGKHDALIRAGLLSVPVMLWAADWNSAASQDNPGVTLPEDQAILLARYQLARWGADPVAWCLPGDGSYENERAERWRRIGRAVFGGVHHAPATLHPNGQQWIGDFKNEAWLDYLGYQSGHGDGDAYDKWLLEGPPARRWQDEPLHPVVNLEPPYENHLAYQSRRPFSAHATRKRLYWSLFVHPTAGVTYGGHGVWGWDDGSGPPTAHPDTGTPLPWREALEMPAAEQMAYLHKVLAGLNWWQLRPAPELLAEQPGLGNTEKYLVAARSEAGDQAVVYAPENEIVRLKRLSSAPNPTARWFDPTCGETHRAEGEEENGVIRYEVPAGEDWLLILESN